MRPPRLRTFLSLALGLLLVVGLLWYVGPGRVASTMGRASPVYLAFAVLAYAAFFVLRGLRWRVILEPVAPRASLATATGLTAFGWVLNTFLPMKAGDVARAALLDRRERTGLMTSAGTVAVERALDVVGLAATASIALFLAPRVAATEIPAILSQAVAVAWVLPLVGLTGLLVLARASAGRDAPGFIGRLIRNFSTAMEGIRQNPRALARLLPLTFAVAGAQVIIFIFVVRAFDPAFPMLALVAGIPIFLLSFVIAVTPGNVGTYEAAFVAVFALLGKPPADLIPLAVACHVATTAIVTVLGAAAAAWLRLRAGERATVSEALEVNASR